MPASCLKYSDSFCLMATLNFGAAYMFLINQSIFVWILQRSKASINFAWLICWMLFPNSEVLASLGRDYFLSCQVIFLPNKLLVLWICIFCIYIVLFVANHQVLPSLVLLPMMPLSYMWFATMQLVDNSRALLSLLFISYRCQIQMFIIFTVIYSVIDFCLNYF